MNATELAHWRYRVKAIEPELQAARSDRRDVLNYTPYITDDIQEWFTNIMQCVDENIELTRWLHEEAKYMSELGAITVEREENPIERLQRIMRGVWT